MNDEKKPTLRTAFVRMTDEEVEQREKLYNQNISEMAKSYREEAKNEYMVKDIKKGPEEKEYLLLLVDIEDNDATMFTIVMGRRAAYDYIKEDIKNMDIHKSTILVEGLPLERRVTVYEFMKHIQEKNFFEDSFDIEDYNIGDIESEDDAFEDDDISLQESEKSVIERVSPFAHLDSDSEDI